MTLLTRLCDDFSVTKMVYTGLEKRLDYTPENAKAHTDSGHHSSSCTAFPQSYSGRLFTKPFSGSYANAITVYLEELKGSRMLDYIHSYYCTSE